MRSTGRRAALVVVLGATVFVFAGGAAGMPASRPSSRPASSQPSTMPVGDGAANDLTSLSLEDLMNVEVTSVARQKQRVGEAAAAITVITQEDIQRSGLTSVPELLRLVPGMDVARLNASTWAISSRGFNDAFANKLLVLSDGRSIYSPLFAGVFWDMHQPLLQDIEQIEVIRGPGATIWGSNAVNGVINIQSKSARDTQGLLVTGRGGNYEQSGAARFGGQIDDKTFFRFTGRYQNTDDFPTTAGPDGHDGWHAIGGAFRLDRYGTDKDTFTVQGDLTSTREAETLLLGSFTPPTFMAPTTNSFNALGIDVLGRWTHVFSDQSDLALQVYYDHLTRPVGGSPYHIDTGDIDFHHRFPLGDRQEIVWGLGYRYWADEFKPGPAASMNPQNRDDYIANAYIQDDLTIVKDRLHLIGGTKIEENTYSGFEVQPSGRMVWTPNEQNTLWGAVSRAQRTPARWEQDGRIVSAPSASPLLPVPVQPVVHGTREFDSEGMNAFEVGYRLKPAPKFSLDTAIFYNAYDHLRGFEPGMPGFSATPVPHAVEPVIVANSFYAESYGAEIAANWQVSERWRLAASYSFLNIRAYSHESFAANPANQQVSRLYENSSPRNQFQLHSYLDITKNLQLNASLYFVDRLAALGVPYYVRGDLSMSWFPKKNLELTAGVQNVFDSQHVEFVGSGTTFAANTEVPRTFYGQIVFRY